MTTLNYKVSGVWTPIAGDVNASNPVNDWISANTPTPWTALTLINGWAAYPPETPSYRKIGDVVYLRGAMNKINSASTYPFILPAGFRPQFQHRYAVSMFKYAVGGSYVVRCDIQTDGYMIVNEVHVGSGWNNADNAVISLANIQFSTI